jgi:hypothetical protein
LADGDNIDITRGRLAALLRASPDWVSRSLRDLSPLGLAKVGESGQRMFVYQPQSFDRWQQADQEEREEQQVVAEVESWLRAVGQGGDIRGPEGGWGVYTWPTARIRQAMGTGGNQRVLADCDEWLAQPGIHVFGFDDLIPKYARIVETGPPIIGPRHQTRKQKPRPGAE